jgi:hypothetical protein
MQRITRTALGSVTCLLALFGSQAWAQTFNCNTASAETCTITVSPDGGAGVDISAPGTRFSARVDGSGFEISGTVHLSRTTGDETASASAFTLFNAELVVEYANPAVPSEGFRRLHGSAEMNSGAAAEVSPGFGTLGLTGDQNFRVDVGIELGSVLQETLSLQHLNPGRPCKGVREGEPGFLECPYWIFRVVDQKSIAGGFGGTDVGFNATADASSERNVTFLMDPEDFFVYVGFTDGAMDSVTLKIEPTAGEDNGEEAPLLNAENGLGFSQKGYIPFEPRTTYGIESEIKALGLNFEGHIVIDKADIPLGPFVKMDGSMVFKLPVDELSGQAQFDNHWQAAGNGNITMSLPLFKAVNWAMDLGSATAGATVTSTQQYIYVSGDINKDFPWAPAGLPMSLDYRNNYRAAAVLVNNVDPDTAVPGVDLTDSFVQMEGEYLIDFSLGQSGSEFGREMHTNGFLRADMDNGIEFWGSVGTGASATMIHPLIQADANARLYLAFNPAAPRDTLVEVTGEFNVGSETLNQEAVLRVTPADAYLGFPLSFDPTLILKAYNDFQDATRDAEAEVNKLTAEIEKQREIVRKERETETVKAAAAQADVDAAQAEVNKLNSRIAKHYSNIRYYKGRIGSWYRWYKKQPWYKRATAWATYTAKKAYYNGLIGAQYAAIGGIKVALVAANGALEAAKLTLKGYAAVVTGTPIDLDPRIAPVVAARDVALATLNAIQSTMPEIPEIPGTIQATAGFRIDGSGLTPETRAQYCDNGSCIDIKGGSYDAKAGKACITLPTQGNTRVCTAIPAEPI